MASQVKARPAKKARQFLVDENGERTAVILPIEEYAALVEAAEQLDDIRHLEKAKAVRGKPTPWEQVKAELRAEGKLR
jgi:PHD/YefM family antitoxin component YafN of YafNO toxin-antitoxin module